jgi:probable rRNA maturation factor
LKIGLKNSNFVKKQIDRGKIGKLIEQIFREENKKLGEIEIVFLKDPEILKINREFLKHDYFTDVIAFGYNQRGLINGDLCIGIECVSRNALKYNVSFKNELIRVIIHGVFHLIGYDDKNPEGKEEMKRKEDFYLYRYDMTVNE